jgi:hypothetical protein
MRTFVCDWYVTAVALASPAWHEQVAAFDADLDVSVFTMEKWLRAS